MKRKNWLKNKFLHVIYAIGREYSGFRIPIRRKQSRKNILLYCSSRTMEEHLVNFMEQLEDISSYTLYLCFGDNYPARKKQDKPGNLV